LLGVLLFFVAQCLQQYRDLALGPKNKPRLDKHGLLGVLLSVLDEKACNCDASLAAAAAAAASATADAGAQESDAVTGAATPVEPPA
jgi:hypothetical protein